MSNKTVVDSVYGKFTPEWKLVRLGDICVSPRGVQTGPFGSQLHQRDYQQFGTPIIRVEHLGENRILHQELSRVSDSDYQRLNRYVLKIGDIVFSRVGSVDRRALVRKPENGWLFSSSCLRVRPNSKYINSSYLSYFFGLPGFKAHIRRIAVGATRPSLNTSILSNLDIILPPLPEQKAIASILSSLDDKIKLNQQMNQTLEAIARAIFKSWFVDFDPVRAKMAGNQPVGMDAATANLFPDSFEESALGLIPKGWTVKSADNICNVAIGKTPPRKESYWFSTNDNNIRWVSIRDMGENGLFISDTKEYLVPEAIERFNIKVIPDNTVLFSFKLTIGRVVITDGEMTTNEAIAHFNIKSQEQVSSEYLYLYLKNFDYNQLGNTSSIAQAVNSKIIKTMPILIPDSDLINHFTKQVNSIFIKIKTNQRESQTLANTRDTLLPKLMSGEK